MSAFVWEDKYCLQVGEIDQQHQRLFALFNDLYDAMQQGRGPEAVDKVLTSVIDYTVYHFACEEKLMDQAGYPQSAAHKAEHRKLTDQAKALSQRLRDGSGDVTMATLKFLGDWLARHILVADKALAPYLAGQGLH